MQRKNGNLTKAVLCLAVLWAAWACAPKITVETVPEPEPVISGETLVENGTRRFEGKEYEQALLLFGEYLARFPEGPAADTALMMAGASHLAMNRYEEARSRFGRLIDRFPSSRFLPDAQLGIIGAYFSEGKYENVVRAFRVMGDGAFTTEQAVRAYMFVAEAYWILGEAAEAALFFSRAHINIPEAEREAVAGKISEALRLLSNPEITALVESATPPAARSLLSDLAEPFRYNRYSLGCLLPLSGRYASYGNRALKGIELALARFTAGKDAPDFTIRIRDTGGDPEKAAAAVRELVAEDRVAAIIGSILTAETAALEAQIAGIPIVTMTQKEQITQIGDYVFRNFFTPEMQVRALVSYCDSVLGLGRYAILYPDEPYGNRFMNLFWDRVMEAGGSVVGVESYAKDQTDFADPIKKLVGLYYELPDDLKELRSPPVGDVSFSGAGFDSMLMDPVGARSGRPHEDRFRRLAAEDGTDPYAEPEPVVDFDAVFIPDAPGKAGLIIPQLAFYDVNEIYLLGTNLWYSDSLIEMTRQYAQGALIPVGFFPDSRSDHVQAFTDDFIRVYGEAPGFIEAIAHDTAAILLERASRPAVGSRSALKDALLNGGVYEGATGATRFDSSGDVIKELRLVRIKGGRFIELDTGNRP